jgi:hypothetical protein
VVCKKDFREDNLKKEFGEFEIGWLADSIFSK